MHSVNNKRRESTASIGEGFVHSLKKRRRESITSVSGEGFMHSLRKRRRDSTSSTSGEGFVRFGSFNKKVHNYTS